MSHVLKAGEVGQIKNLDLLTRAAKALGLKEASAAGHGARVAARYEANDKAIFGSVTVVKDGDGFRLETDTDWQRLLALTGPDMGLLLQRYQVEEIKSEASRRGLMAYEIRLASGEIQVEVEGVESIAMGV